MSTWLPQDENYDFKYQPWVIDRPAGNTPVVTMCQNFTKEAMIQDEKQYNWIWDLSSSMEPQETERD